MKKIKVPLGARSYYILIKKGIISSSGRIIKKLNIANACFIVTNKKIKALYGSRLKKSLLNSGLDAMFHTVADSERSKSHLSWFRTTQSLARFDRGRGVCVISLGGGVVGDLGGFVAATYRRGTAFIQIPTTLLAQVDSSIGGKVAIDLDFAKNLVGAFHQPRVVLTDPHVLRTLSSRQISNGMAEVVKYAVIFDKRLFSYLEKNISRILKLDPVCMEYIIYRCSRLKAEVVGADEKEKKGYRSVLNFGHTIGHAIESASCYKQTLNHGEAISIGMLAAFDIATNLGMITDRSVSRLEGLLKKAGLPAKAKGINPLKVIAATGYDKKIINGRKRWIIPEGIGHTIICSNVPADIIKESVLKRVVQA
jgi:3-dehydroquinate synthase